jgi:predicted acetyltransferase
VCEGRVLSERQAIESTMTAEIEIRTCTAADWPSFCDTMAAAFGQPMSDEGAAQWKRVLDFDKMLVATAQEAGRETVVGTAGWLPFDMLVPGGEIPVAAVTMVTVSPTRRRRGILRQLMRRQLDDLHEAGITVATLWASEAPIYQRFGYGLGYLKGRIEVDPRRVRFLKDHEPVGRTRLVTQAEAAELLPGVYDRARRGIPGSFRRTQLWWEVQHLDDGPYRRHGASPMFRMVLEIDGTIEGYALYRVTTHWGPNALPDHEVDVLEALGTSPDATREVWRYLFNLDLVGKVSTHRLNAQHPLFLGLTNLRLLQMMIADGTWVRLVDVDAALTARRYGSEGSLTFELDDPFCRWNAGVWTLEAAPDGATARRSTAAPELRLSMAELSAMYLGTVPCSSLALAGRLDELAPGAARRADLMFRSDVPPWCLDDF